MTKYEKKPISPMPWRRDVLNNVYDADGMLIFTARAHNDEVGVMIENDGNSELIVMMSKFMHQESIESIAQERIEDENNKLGLDPTNVPI